MALAPLYFGPTSLVVSIGTASATAREISFVRRSWKSRVTVAAVSACLFFSMIFADITTMSAMAPRTRHATASEARISTNVNARFFCADGLGFELRRTGIIGRTVRRSATG